MEVFRDKQQKQGQLVRVPFRFQYRVSEAAVLLGLSERSLHTLISDKEIVSYKLRGSRFISTKQLREFVEKVSTAEEAA